MSIRIKLLRKIAVYLFIFLILVNIVVALHAWRFTHFSDDAKPRTNSEGLSWPQKIGLAITGIQNPRPVNRVLPSWNYSTKIIQSNKKIEVWDIPADSSKGTVVLFHGYGGSKSSMLDKAAHFRELGYSTRLVDFMGSGGSEGNQTTIGYFESIQVFSCVEDLRINGEEKIYLVGTSLGAAAILKCFKDHPKLKIEGIILECPFGSMLETTKARFRNQGVESFPLAHLLVFWGGVENGFWAFDHNPEQYAISVNAPMLLMYGEKDDRVSRAEIDSIFQHVSTPKNLITFPEAGHENYMRLYSIEWKEAVSTFMKRN